jgi:flagellin-like hook-associated protein FlgL
MRRMGIYDQIKAAIQDLIAPELQGIRGDIRRLDQKIDDVDARLTTKIDSLHAQMGSMKNELVSEIRRVDVRIDSVDRELRVAIDIRERLAALEARRT